MYLRPMFLILGLFALSGCAALSTLTRATEELNAYTLQPLPQTDFAARGAHLVVALPTSAGALATDSILIKPSAVQAQYLPDGRWTEPTPLLLQTLLVASLQNAGGFQLVDRDGAGLLPDFTLMTELLDFQAEPVGPDPTTVLVRVGVTMTLIRESDLSILTTRRFTATATAANDSTLDLVEAFDTATRQLLTQVVEWTKTQTD